MLAFYSKSHSIREGKRADQERDYGRLNLSGMGSLKSREIHVEPDPKVAFGLKLLGCEKLKGETLRDWRNCKVWIEIFLQRLERSEPKHFA